MNLLVINMLNGISFGMILFLLAVGLSITLGVMGILNLAHGALFVIGGFAGLSVIRAGGNFWIAILCGSIGAGLVGFLTERLFLNRLYRQLDEQALLTLGLVYIIQNIILWIYGGGPARYDPPSFFDVSVAIGDYAFPAWRLVLIIVGIVAFVAIWWLIEKTKVGAIIRSGMDDREMAVGLGLNYRFICSAVFALGAFMGGFAGSMATPVLGIVFSMSMQVLLYALIVVVVGGTGSITGTMIGALLIGMVDAFGKAFFPDFAMFTIYIVLIIMLAAKPAGIMGKAYSSIQNLPS